MLVKEWQTKLQAAVTIEKNRQATLVCCEGNEFVSTVKVPGKHYQCTRNDFESSESYTFFMIMLSRQKLVDSIILFGSVWQNGHTLASFKKLRRKSGSPGLFRRCSAKRKQQSPLRQIVNTTRRYVQGKKCLTLSLCWIFPFGRYCLEHISRSLCWTEMIIRLVLVIFRKWKSTFHLLSANLLAAIKGWCSERKPWQNQRTFISQGSLGEMHGLF